MAGGKLSPRQQMINMMYLVLTALLAMNVSKEILNAFISIDEGQLNTRSSLEDKLANQMGNFQALAGENPAKYKDPYEKAKGVDTEAKALISHINKIKAQIISVTEGLPLDNVLNNDTIRNIRYLSQKDNKDVATEIMYGSDKLNPHDVACERCDGNNFSAVDLKRRLLTFSENVQNSVKGMDAGLAKNINDLFSYPDAPDASGDMQIWEYTNFNDVPMAAVISILSKLQSDVRSAQSDVIGVLFSDVEKSSYKFTSLADAVIPQATTITQGSNYEAEVFLAAFDEQNAPKIYLGNPGVRFDSTKMALNGESVLLEMDGVKGKVKLPAGGLGSQQREGFIEFKPIGAPKAVITPFKLDYTVVAPQLVVSPTKMNVFYRGVDNPVSVGVPGFTDKDVTASCEGCTINKGSDGYIVRVDKGKEAKIFASAKLPDGGTKRLGPASFRIKSVPDPVPQFAGKGAADAVVKKAELTAAQGVVAKMKDFEFDLKFTVTQFKVGMIIGGQYVEQISKSNRVTGDMKTMLSKAKRGQKVFIEGIKAKGPDGRVRNLGSLAFKVN